MNTAYICILCLFTYIYLCMYVYIYISCVQNRHVVHIQLFQKISCLHPFIWGTCVNRVGGRNKYQVRYSMAYHISNLWGFTVLHSTFLPTSRVQHTEASSHVVSHVIFWITSIYILYIYHIIKVRQILSHHVTSCHVVSHHNYDISFGQIIATKSPRWRIQNGGLVRNSLPKDDLNFRF